MNVEKIRQVGQAILKEPRRFNMSWWMQPVNLSHDYFSHPPCGTTLCFAGQWAVRFGGLPIRPREESYMPSGATIPDACQKDLQLPNDKLFYENSWPNRVRARHLHLAGTREYAEHFVNVVLEDYIATNGWQNPPEQSTEVSP